MTPAPIRAPSAAVTRAAADHGAEPGVGAALAGLVPATAMLHPAGVGLGLALRHRATLRAGSGLALAGLGLSLLAA